MIGNSISVEQRGASLLETTVCLGLSALLTLPLVRAAASASLAHSRTGAGITTLENISAVRQLLRTISHECDSHPLPIPSRIHRGGLITTAAGHPNAISLRSTATSPHPDSDAITSIQASTETRQQVRSCTPEHGGAQYHACGAPFDTTTHRTFLALGVDGMRELTGSSIAIRGTDCRIFSLHPIDSMLIAPAEAFEACSMTVLIPIAHTYTLYVDSNRTLRYLGHEGTANIENQPMTTLSGDLRLTLTPEHDSITHLSARLVNQAGHEFPVWNGVHHLSRIHPLNLALNR